ncbi:MAG: hypothetical protein FJ125_08675, partial [Deltaproteobacteria bacterium]|nr:hypothetical protein [Deltaproteobacteria bacterium]
MSTSHHGASFLPARPLLLAALLLASPLLASPLLGGCGSDGAPPDRPGGPGDVVAVHGLLQLSLLAAPSAPAGEGAGDIARKPQALESGSLSVVALGSNLRTTTVPVDASGEFRVTVKKNTSYTLNLLDNITKQYLASFLYRSGSNISIALKVGDGDVDLGQCQLVEGEVWCANGFFDSPLASGSIEPARDLFGKVRVELEPAPADVPLVERLLGGTTADFEVVPNPENEFHVALFERRAVECGEPLLGVAERVGQERYLYVARVLASDTCRATARYQWVCTMGGQGACSGYYRLDIASSGEDCTSYPPLHVAGPLDLAVSSPGSTECSAPPSCTGHSDCASGICDMDVGFCAAAPPTSALRIYLFDVGNGQSALLVSPVGTSVLLDAGRPQAGRLTSAIARRLTQRLDYMVLSHFDDDHAGGALPFILGPDAMPGRRGVDDDGANGVDDEWEIGSPGSDDLMPGLVLDRGLTPMPSGFDAYARVLGSRRRQAVPGESFDLGGGVQMTVLSANGGIAGGSTFLVDEENERSVGVVVRHG